MSETDFWTKELLKLIQEISFDLSKILWPFSSEQILFPNKAMLRAH